MDAVNLQGVWPNFPGTAVVPEPEKKKPVAAAKSKGGGSFVSPTEPLYSPPACPTWKPPKGVLDKLFSKKSTSEPDPLEVLRDAKKTEERVKKSELRALRKRYAALEKEAGDLRASKGELRAALKRIAELELELRCLREDVARIESLRWQALRWRPAHAVRPQPDDVIAPAAVIPKPQDRWLPAVRATLPYVGGSALSAVFTYYVVPDNHRTLKFVGYGGSIVILLVGIGVGLDILMGGRDA